MKKIVLSIFFAMGLFSTALAEMSYSEKMETQKQIQPQINKAIINMLTTEKSSLAEKSKEDLIGIIDNLVKIVNDNNELILYLNKDNDVKVNNKENKKNINREEAIKNAKKAGWKFTEDRDAMTDVVISYAAKQSVNSINFISKNINPAIMFVNKGEGDNNILVHLGNIYVEPSFGETYYNVRIDKNTTHSLDGKRIWEGHGIAFENVSNELIQEIRNGSQLVIRIPTMGTGTHDIKWNLKGASSAWDVIIK